MICSLKQLRNNGDNRSLSGCALLGRRGRERNICSPSLASCSRLLFCFAPFFPEESPESSFTHHSPPLFRRSKEQAFAADERTSLCHSRLTHSLVLSRTRWHTRSGDAAPGVGRRRRRLQKANQNNLHKRLPKTESLRRSLVSSSLACDATAA